MRASLAITFAAAASLLSASAKAEECTAEEAARAKPHFAEGAKAFRVGELQRAADAFKAAYEACPSPLILYNMGQVERQRRNNEKALYFYKQYLSTTSPSDERRADVQKWISQLQEQIDNQRKIQEAPPPGPAVPGSAADASTASEHPRAPAQGAQMPGGEATSIKSGNVLAPAARRRWIIGGAVTAGIGAAALAAGIAFGVLAKQASDTLSRNDAARVPFDNSTYQAGQRDQILEGVFIGVGAAAIVAGGVVAILGARNRSSARAAIVPSGDGFTVRF